MSGTTVPQHTPGPWRVIGRSPDPLAPDEIAIGADIPAGLEIGPRAIPTRRAGVMCVAVTSPIGVRPDRYPELASANARLIAAAPDLLSACKALLDGVERTLCGCHEAYTSRGLTDPDCHRCGLDLEGSELNAARAAIAKAEDRA